MQLYDISTPQSLRGLRQNLILPGDIEPEWLHRNAEHRRILRDKDTGVKVVPSDEKREPRGIADRVRQAFSRAG